MYNIDQKKMLIFIFIFWTKLFNWKDDLSIGKKPLYFLIFYENLDLQEKNLQKVQKSF
jgi:hypothetical protein